MTRMMGSINLIFKMVSLNDRFDNEKKDSRSLYGSFIWDFLCLILVI